jgi:hypothetical protein
VKIFLVDKARSSFRPLFLSLVAGAWLSVWAWHAGAVCQPNSYFITRGQYEQNAPVSQTDLAVSEGGRSLTLDLALSIADAGINISGSNFSPIVTVTLNEWQWRLRVPGNPDLDLSVSYQVAGSDGTPGVLTSVLDPYSKVNATVLSRDIVRHGSNWYGYIDLQLDFSNAMRSGPYTGTITVFLNCEYE